MLHFNSTVKPVITLKVEVNNNLNTYHLKVETVYRGRRNFTERPKVFDFNRFQAIRLALTKFHIFKTRSNLAVIIIFFLPGIYHNITNIWLKFTLQILQKTKYFHHQWPPPFSFEVGKNIAKKPRSSFIWNWRVYYLVLIAEKWVKRPYSTPLCLVLPLRFVFHLIIPYNLLTLRVSVTLRINHYTKLLLKGHFFKYFT